MPELPDLTIYIDALESRISGEVLLGIRVASPFVLRSVEPSIDALVNHRVTGFNRIGKRIIIALEDDCYIAVHLMIAGRFRWYKAGARIPGKLGLMAFDFTSGTLVLTEASQKHRASVYLVRGATELAAFDLGGLEVLDITLDEFRHTLERENHTLKRSLTDQRFLAGIGNAYSDEILHHARISPMRQVKYLTDQQWQDLYNACQSVLKKWIGILDGKSAGKFPTKVTAFHAEMAVHGKYKQPCPDCGKPVQRIRYASNECNYCAKCQNQGKLLADRGLSRLLKKDWPKTLEELDQ
jgi:formamidopyrimidine-DNA glycosylase